MRLLSKIFLVLGVILSLPTLLTYIILQMYSLSPYWFFISVCLYYLLKSYKKNYFNLKVRIFLYVISLCNIFMVYGFGVFCYGDYSFNIISQSFCLSLNVILSESFTWNLFLLYIQSAIGLVFIEIAFILKIAFLNPTRFLKD